MLIKGTALVWSGEEEHELREGGIVHLPRNVHTPTASPPTAQTS
jgi:quercetin dioxygenase-like cupin family protein